MTDGRYRLPVTYLPTVAEALAADPAFAAVFERVFALDRDTYGDGVTDALAHIEAKIDAAALAGGGTVFVDGVYRVTRPVRGRSHVMLHLTPGSMIFASDTGGNFVSATILPGHYSPNWLHTAGGTLNHDAIDGTGAAGVLAAGDTEVTLTSNDHEYAVDDLVVIYTSTISYVQLTKILAVDGDTLTLADPLPVEFAGGTAFISAGGGDGSTFNPDEGPTVEIEAYFVEDFHVFGGTIKSTTGSWMNRAACYQGSFTTNIYGRGAVYGNAYTRCRFDITGIYTDRAVEVTDGARDNFLRINVAYRDVGLLAGGADPAVKLGRGDILAGRIRERSDRSGYVISILQPRSTVRDFMAEITGANDLAGLIDIGSQTGLPAGTVMDNVRITCDQAVNGTALLQLAYTSDASLRDVTLDAPIAGSTKSVRLSGTVSNCALDQVRAPTAQVELVASATIDAVTFDRCDVLSFDGSLVDDHLGRIAGRGNRIRNQDELARLIRTQQRNVAIAATTETAAQTNTFAAAQDLYLGDKILVATRWQKQGTAGSTRVKLTVGGNVIVDHTGPTTAGYARMEGAIEVMNPAGTEVQYDITVVTTGGTVTTYSSRITGFALGSASTIVLAVWKGDAGDTLTLRNHRLGFQSFLAANAT